MRQASAALISLLNGGGNQFIMGDLYTITLTAGTVLRYSAATTALTVNGNVFALGPKFERSNTKVVTGIQVDSLTVKVYPEPTDLIGATPFLQALWTGQLDGALLQLERVFMPTYGDTSAGTVVLFAGRISGIDCSRTGATISVKSHLELLNIQMPRRIWQPSCNNHFGDAMCTFNRSSMALTFAAGAGSTQINITGAPVTTTPFNLGSIVGQTGQNAGYSRTISMFKSGVSVSIKLAFLFPIAAGDQFQLLPGCDRTLGTCTSVFNNAIHFGGQPYIPTPETSV
jgi:uncharacterized phage protein (TIGR02218 family)